MFSNDLTVIFGFLLDSCKIILLIDVIHKTRTWSAKVTLCTEPTAWSFKTQLTFVISWFMWFQWSYKARGFCRETFWPSPLFPSAQFLVGPHRLSSGMKIGAKASLAFCAQTQSTPRAPRAMRFGDLSQMTSSHVALISSQLCTILSFTFQPPVNGHQSFQSALWHKATLHNLCCK